MEESEFYYMWIQNEHVLDVISNPLYEQHLQESYHDIVLNINQTVYTHNYCSISLILIKSVNQKATILFFGTFSSL